MISKIKQYDVWLANFDAKFGTEPGKIRPVVVIQTDILSNAGHLSTIVCPVTSRVVETATILRVHLSEWEAGTEKPSDVLVDQLRSIDNLRFLKKLGSLDETSRQALRTNIKVVLDL